MAINLKDKRREAMQSRRGQGGGGHVADLIAKIKEVDVAKGVVYAELDAESHAAQQGYPTDIALTINRNLDIKENRQAEWQGDIVSEGMAEAFEVGETFIAKNVILPGDKSSTDPYPMDRVVSIPAANPDKVFEGIFTTSGYVKMETDEKGNRKPVSDENGYPVFVTNQLQRWARNGMAPEDFLNDDMKGVYDEAVADFNDRQKMRADGVDPKKMPPVKSGMAVSLRVLDNENNLVYQMPQMSVYAVEGEDGKRSYQHVTFDDIKATIEDMQAEYPDHKVEVLPVQTFPIAPSIGDPTNENYKPFPGIEKPRYMAMSSARESVDGERPPIGNSMRGVHGVASLQGGKLNPKTGERQGAENERVSQLYVNARKYHISELVSDAQGNSVNVPEEMRVDLLERNEIGTRNNGAEQENAAKEAQAPANDAGADEGAPANEEDALLDDAVNARAAKQATPGA